MVSTDPFRAGALTQLIIKNMIFMKAGLVVAVALDDKSDGPKTYTATQVPTVNSLPAIVPARASDRTEIKWGVGPVNVRLISFIYNLY